MAIWCCLLAVLCALAVGVHSQCTCTACTAVTVPAGGHFSIYTLCNSGQYSSMWPDIASTNSDSFTVQTMTAANYALFESSEPYVYFSACSTASGSTVSCFDSNEYCSDLVSTELYVVVTCKNLVETCQLEYYPSMGTCTTATVSTSTPTSPPTLPPTSPPPTTATVSPSGSSGSHPSPYALSFIGNITLTGSSASLDFRAVEFSVFNLPHIMQGATYISVEVTGTISTTSDSGTVDGIAGLFAVDSDVDDSLDFPPFVVLAYCAASESAKVNADSLSYTDPSLSDLMPFSVSASGVLSAFTSITEYNSAGTQVKSLDLDDLWFVTGSVQPNGELSFVTFNGTTRPESGYTVSFTVGASSVAGRLNVGNPITPKNLEIVFSITGYPYTDQGNYLSLTIYSVTIAQSSGSSSPNILVAGTGSTAPYVYFSQTATVDGQNATVDISSASSDSSEFGELLDAAIEYYTNGFEPTFFKTTIKFPPNAVDIIYDPAVGFDPCAVAGVCPSGGLAAWEIAVIVVGAVLGAALLIGLAIFAYHKSKMRLVAYKNTPVPLQSISIEKM